MATDTTFDQKKYDDLRKKLSSSPTAYTPGVAPTKSDIKNQMDLMSLEKTQTIAESEEAKLNWYGPDTKTAAAQEEGAGKTEGMFSKLLNILSVPLYGVVGGVEAITGTGSEKGLKNIAANIKERGTFGDLLRRGGTPRLASMPLGLALDIAFDPLNWATAGTAALIPRVYKGIKAAGLTGAKVGAETSLLGRTATRLLEKTGAERFAGAAAKIPERADYYDTLIGRNFDQEMVERAAKPSVTDKAADWLENKMPGFKKAFVYDNQGNLIEQRAEQAVEVAERGIKSFSPTLRVGNIESVLGRTGMEVDESFDLLDEINRLDDVKKAGANPVVAKAANDAVNIVNKDYKMMKGTDSGDVLDMLGDEATQANRVRTAVSDTLSKYDETGWKAYDDFMKNVREIGIRGQYKMGNVLDTYAKGIGLFKNVKTSGNPASYVLATVGNLTMTKLSGLKMDSDFFNSLKNGLKLSTGRAADPAIVDFIQSPQFKDFAAKNPKLLPSIFGLTWEKLNSQEFLKLAYRSGIETAEKAAKAAGKVLTDTDKDKLSRETMELITQFQDEVRRITPVQLQRGGYATGIDLTAGRVLREGRAIETTGLVQDIYSTPYKDFLEKLGSSDNAVSKALYGYLTKSAELYENVDQSFKLGTLLKVSHKGISQEELEKLSKIVKINPGDYEKVGGKYLLSLDKGMDVASEIYMNYMAMPTAARVLRQMPLLGAPFASFTYAMAGKTAKTLVNNPAVFNKINYALQEASGEKSPLEKLALDEQYYQRYKDPGMVKLNFLPFFKDNPIYLNLENMLPYYTLNIFQPSERRFNETLPDAVATLVDKLPILKTPEGQIMFDYFILPMMLKDADPKGMFNQPLYPQDANALEKYVAYPARQAVEALIPPVAGLAGLATPTAVADFLPSYQGRKLSYAKEGKTPVGVVGKEPKFQRTARAMASVFGLPIYPVNLSYVSAKQKEKTTK